jgi:hypothetical protein
VATGDTPGQGGDLSIADVERRSIALLEYQPAANCFREARQMIQVNREAFLVDLP